jgi:hypothetical protein
MQNKKPKISRFKKELETLKSTMDETKFEEKVEKLKNNEVKALLFDKYLRETNNEKQGMKSITTFFSI